MKPLRKDELSRARILIRTPNWIGDAVMCLPALRALRSALPDAELVLVARPWVIELFPKEELRCRTIAYDAYGVHRGITGRYRIATDLRKGRFQGAILFQNAFDAALLALLAGTPIRAGYARHGRRLLLTHPVDVPRTGETPSHESHYYLELLRRLGLIESYPEVREISLPHSSGARERARARLAQLEAEHSAAATRREKLSSLEGKPVIGISPGAAFGTAKRWVPERFAELARRLDRELDAVPVFFGSKDEALLAESLVPDAGERCFSLAGRTSLSDFLHVIPGCDLYVTNDTGAMHVAAAFGVPTLAIFGPTDEQGTQPLGPRVQMIIGEADCRPCKLRHCPIDHRCMHSVSVDTVFEAARSLLERPRNMGPSREKNYAR